jgi:hypothetical protein
VKNAVFWDLTQCGSFKNRRDSVRREELCNILIEFGEPINFFRLIEMCLNEIYFEVRK